MTRQEIERAIEEAGWRLDSGFADYLILGHDDRASIMSPRWAWNLDSPVFELSDELKDVTYWITEIPTPQEATELLEEHGGPPEEEWGNPYKNAHSNPEDG